MKQNMVKDRKIRDLKVYLLENDIEFSAYVRRLIEILFIKPKDQ